MINCMLDSGAFSAWTQGKQVDLNTYCDYIERNQEWIGEYVALDVINPKDPHAAAEASFENLIKMRKRGLRPLPVFHVGESFDWLHRMLDLGCDYIGLSATSLTGREDIDPWYKSAWAHLVEQDGLPIIKAHAFGENRAEALNLFPWASADSTSWIYKSQITGTLMLPGAKRIGVRNVKIDKAQGFFTNENHIHYTARNAPVVDLLETADKACFDAELLKYGILPGLLEKRDQLATFLRTYLTVLRFMDLEKETRARHPIQFMEMQTAFQLGRGLPKASSAEPIDVDPFNLYFVTNATWWSIVIPAKAGVKNVLASFFYIQEFPNHFRHLPAYVRDPIGFITGHEKAAKLWNLLGEHIKT